MSKKNLFFIFSAILVFAFLLTACGDGSTEEGGFQIPATKKDKFNVAMILIGPHDDGGWSQAHYEGLLYLEDHMDDVHTAYVELVPEGADSEQVTRSLARKGFDLIIGTSFGYMDGMETVAEEFPSQMFIHLTGFKSNMENFGNLMGAMEDMKYLTGVLAGARCHQDGQTKTGYMATFPIPEELRLGNAFALGLQKYCPECTLDIRWLNTWHDPIIEKEAAASLFDAGAYVVLTGADTPAPADVATERGDVWGITYDWVGSCTAERCLTAPYWSWGIVYQEIAEGTRDGSYTPGWHYFDADTGALGLYGFMDDQEMTAGVADLDPEVLTFVEDTVAQMLAGDFDRFDVFSGEIIENQGNVIVPEGEQMGQLDLDQFPVYDLGCTYCMYWWNENITAELPE